MQPRSAKLNFDYLQLTNYATHSRVSDRIHHKLVEREVMSEMLVTVGLLR